MNYDAKASGLRIKQLRINSGLTMEELSHDLNISDRQLRRIEKGESAGSIDVMVEISKRFDVSLDYLIYGKINSNSDIKKLLRKAVEFFTYLEKEL